MDSADAYAFHTAGKIDQKARKAAEIKGHAIFKAGGDKLTPAQEAQLRKELLKACAGLESEVEISMLTLTSPDGVYGDHPKVRAGP
jgi:hypothetical protein